MRLNLVPREKTHDTRGSQSTPAPRQVPEFGTPSDHLEENCHMGSNTDFRPKLGDGKGPLGTS